MITLKIKLNPDKRLTIYCEHCYRPGGDDTLTFCFHVQLPQLSLLCRMEAEQCPHVVVADIDTKTYNAKQTVKVSLVSIRANK